MIGWGLGTNAYDTEELRLPGGIEKLTLKGLRDFAPGCHDWVPCVSCMHNVFNDPASPIFDYVIYEHRDYPVVPEASVPRMRNSVPRIEEAAAFLASGSLVITNSYHGAYWATLLKRKVVIYCPFSSKFYWLRWPIPIARDETELAASMCRAVIHDEALAECREANRSFAARVANVCNL